MQATVYSIPLFQAVPLINSWGQQSAKKRHHDAPEKGEEDFKILKKELALQMFHEEENVLNAFCWPQVRV